ncbi:GntR family transcriptional regulator [Clostridia bacterium]|nr:GntR family transcriptional regulator [Clostridia bacterium]
MTKNDTKIYLKIAQALEDDILSGLIREDELVPSANQYAEFYQINPATAAKGVSILLRDGILYKKRGVGLYVVKGARDRVQESRRNAFREEHVAPMIAEAHKIGLSKRDLIAMITAE